MIIFEVFKISRFIWQNNFDHFQILDFSKIWFFNSFSWKKYKQNNLVSSPTIQITITVILLYKKQEKKLALTSFYFLIQDMWLDDLHRPFKITQLHTCGWIEKRFFNSKCFSILNIKTPASWVTHKTGDFFACYSYLH